MDLRRGGARAVAALKELDVRSTSSIVWLIHSESIIIDSVDDDMAADIFLLYCLPMVSS